MQKQQAILPKTLPIDLYQHVLADYLNMSDLIRLSEVFDELGYDNIFSESFWQRKLDTQYGRLLNTLPERKEEESQQINSVLQTKTYREVYSRLQTAKIEPTNLQKKNILELIRKEKDLQNAQYLKNALSEITWLSLSYNQIDAQGASRLADSFKDNTTLTSLNLGCSQIGVQGISNLAGCIRDNKTLTMFDLSDNQINAQGALSLADSLKVNTTLTSLNLYNNQIGDQGASSLADSLKVNKMLTSLNLYNNQIGDQGASSFADSLKINTTLTSFNLGWNQIGDQGASNLADSLKINTTLINLYLEHNQISDQGTSNLADSLKVNTTLTSLSLGWNQIGDQGALRLADSLKINTTLTSFNLGWNQIGAQGVSSLADSLKDNTTLTSLNLGCNQIGVSGASSLADSLKVNTTLTSLNLYNNQIDTQNMNAIDTIIKRNRGFRDQCITALRCGNSRGAASLFKQGVSLNGVLSELIKDKHCQLKTIRTLLQITQDNHLSITRGAIVEAVHKAQDKHCPEIVTFLESWLSKLKIAQIVKEEKIEKWPENQEYKSYSTACCIM